jgi:hypothetical protein
MSDQVGIPKDSAVLRLRHRIDLDLRRVLVLEDLVQVDEDLRGLILSAGLEAELFRNADGGGVVKALLEGDGRSDDRVRVLRGDLLDVHAALRGGNEDGAVRGTVVEHGNIVLVAGVTAFGKHDLISELGRGSSGG